MTFMIAAYLIIWLAAFGFIFSMARRQSALQREIASLRELIKERDDRGR